MNRMDILESMYEVIKDSLEWGLDTKEYGYFVNGVADMTETMLKRLKDKQLVISE